MPTGGPFGPAWLHVTLRPLRPATSVSVGTELPGDRKDVTGGSLCRRARLRLGPGLRAWVPWRVRGGAAAGTRGGGGGVGGGVRAGGVRGDSAALQGCAFPTFGGAVAGSPGSRLVPLPGPDGRTSHGSAFPQRGRPASPYAGGLPGALPGLPVPHTRAGPGRPTARATRKRQRAPSEPVRAPPRP